MIKIFLTFITYLFINKDLLYPIGIFNENNVTSLRQLTLNLLLYDNE